MLPDKILHAYVSDRLSNHEREIDSLYKYDLKVAAGDSQIEKS